MADPTTSRWEVRGVGTPLQAVGPLFDFVTLRRLNAGVNSAGVVTPTVDPASSDAVQPASVASSAIS